MIKLKNVILRDYLSNSSHLYLGWILIKTVDNAKNVVYDLKLFF
ncbi:MAG: hypothetical protein RL637_1404 [Pseudomonadota bacterium]|jgi:hypothetical protein